MLTDCLIILQLVKIVIPLSIVLPICSGGSSPSFGATVVSSILKSPLYTPIVSLARNTMVKTAQNAGLDWPGKAARLRTEFFANSAPSPQDIMNENPTLITEDYYKSKFHGYADGNLCLEAAIEQEIAGKAVGARNFPAEGLNGESVLRGCYDTQIRALGVEAGVQAIEGAVIVDMGCGTGTSTRRLAAMFPRAQSVIGLDLSPHMIAVGRFLNKGRVDWWVEEIVQDSRISFRLADIANTYIPDSSVDMISLSLVLHELPAEVTQRVVAEVYRILKPGGALTIMEMDPLSPGYVKLRSNAMLFAVLQSTEPFLDSYFEFAPLLPAYLQQNGFPLVRVSAATGRHFAIAAFKGGLVNLLPSDEERRKSDQHYATPLKTTFT